MPNPSTIARDEEPEGTFRVTCAFNYKGMMYAQAVVGDLDEPLDISRAKFDALHRSMRRFLNIKWEEENGRHVDWCSCEDCKPNG